MKTQLKLILVFLLFQTFCHAQGVRFAYDNWEHAIKQAKRENKMVFIDAYARWCIPCKKMDPVFRKKDLGQFFNEHFVSVKVNMDNAAGKKLYQKHDVIFLPTVLILDQNGYVRYKSDRVMTASELLDAAKMTVSPTYASAESNPGSYQRSSRPPTSTGTFTKTRSTPRTTTSSPTTKPAAASRPVAKPAQKSTVRPSAKTAKKYARPESIVKENPGEKVLYVLDGNSNPNEPSFLMQEAYFRLQLGDGSHKEKAKKYLASQEDWSTPENMKFILDFLNDISSDESLYLIINRKKFEKEFGEEKIKKNLEFLVYSKLHQGYPRPTLKESQAYFSYLDPTKSKKNAHKYFLQRLYDELNYDAFLELSIPYLEGLNPNDDEVLFTKAMVIDSLSVDKDGLKESIGLLEKATKINKGSYEYTHTLARFYHRNGSKRKAKKAAQAAIQLAKVKQVDYSATEELLKAIEN